MLTTNIPWACQSFISWCGLEPCIQECVGFRRHLVSALRNTFFSLHIEHASLVSSKTHLWPDLLLALSPVTKHSPMTDSMPLEEMLQRPSQPTRTVQGNLWDSNLGEAILSGTSQTWTSTEGCALAARALPRFPSESKPYMPQLPSFYTSGRQENFYTAIYGTWYCFHVTPW